MLAGQLEEGGRLLGGEHAGGRHDPDVSTRSSAAGHNGAHERLPAGRRPLRLDGLPLLRQERAASCPPLSLGLWQNFGTDRPEETQRAILRRAFDRGVTHFDLANNYGPPYGRAEENFGQLPAHRLRRPARRAGDLDQGGLRHVAGALRAGRWVAEVRAVLARPVAGADGPGLRGHLLQPPLRPGDAGRGDDDGAGHGGAVGPGAVRRHLVVLARRRPGRRPRSPASSGRRC